MRRSARQDAFEPSQELELRSSTDDYLTEQPVDGPGVSLAFPEGGREAWMCLLGSLLIMFPSFGFEAAGTSTLSYPICIKVGLSDN